MAERRTLGVSELLTKLAQAGNTLPTTSIVVDDFATRNIGPVEGEAPFSGLTRTLLSQKNLNTDKKL
ncbi:MAG TPA: hypothetical protein VLF93_05725 [Candidatus Saccharimonadales bacterium]|nr:hypothetical protein [Candidatus Saccharimonadales bacterium]